MSILSGISTNHSLLKVMFSEYFDVFQMIAAIRFTCILLAYGLFRICHWWVIAVSMILYFQIMDAYENVNFKLLTLFCDCAARFVSDLYVNPEDLFLLSGHM